MLTAKQQNNISVCSSTACLVVLVVCNTIDCIIDPIHNLVLYDPLTIPPYLFINFLLFIFVCDRSLT